MLLIGSQAAKYHFPDFREPKDIDLIAFRDEVSSVFAPEETLDKYKFKVNDINVEVEVAEPGKASYLLYCSQKLNIGMDQTIPGIGKVKVASPNALFLLKKSHLPFNIHWNKNFFDYLFLKKKNCQVTTQNIFDLRFQETLDRTQQKLLQGSGQADDSS